MTFEIYFSSWSLDSLYLEARDRLDNLAASLLDRWHFPMLNDRVRSEAYSTALAAELSREGCKTVLDLGAGTGLLSLGVDGY